MLQDHLPHFAGECSALALFFYLHIKKIFEDAVEFFVITNHGCLQIS